jgi:uncharacterized protein (DUF1697 family)
VTVTRYVALLRGINVGGNNLIKMPALKACFEEHGLLGVATYIQSGNVVFSARQAGAAEALARALERRLASTFRCEPRVALRTRTQMQEIVGRAPDGFGADAAKYRYDVIYLLAPLSAPEAMKSVALAPGVDAAHAGKGVLYFSRLISGASRSRLSKLIGLPVYQNMTIRNWNTTTKLLRLVEGAGESTESSDS